MRTLSSFVLALVLLPVTVAAQTPAGAPAPAAPGDRAFIGVHVGGQAGTSDLADGFTFPQYDETATVGVGQSYGGGAIVNVEGGVRVFGRLFAGAAVTRGSSTIDTAVAASIPHPLVFDLPRAASSTVELDHRETAIHLFARYVIPAGEKVEIGLSAGPSFINVEHGIVTGVTFQEGGAPFTTVTLTGTTTRDVSETVTTVNVGANVTYRVTRLLGVDGFFRYAKGSTDVTGAGGSVEVDAGGTQFGVGLRLAF